LEITADETKSFRTRLYGALRDSPENAVTVVTTDGGEFTVFGRAFLGRDFFEFQPNDKDQKLMAVPFDRIARLSY
jgi:hypothetical protein